MPKFSLNLITSEIFNNNRLDTRVRIKYCKVICKNSKIRWGIPINFENLTPLDALKMDLRRFFALNEKSKWN